MRIQLLFLAFAAALAGGMWTARESLSELLGKLPVFASEQRPAADKERRGGGGTPVIVRRVEASRNDTVITAVGSARARRSVTIFPKTDGIVVAMIPKAGDRVEAGDVLFKLDDAKARLAVEIARRNLEVSRRLLERAERLERAKVNSDARVDDARTAFERARLELKQAEEALSDLSVVAPFGGVVGLPRVDAGERVTSATPVLSLDMREELFVEFRVPERYLGQISIGQELMGTTPSRGDRVLIGRVDYIDSRVDVASRTATVRASFDNADDTLRPGMSFVVKLVMPGKVHPRVPELALQWLRGESFVWLVHDGKARKTLVRVVQRLNGVVLVEGKISSGSLVVVEGVQRLREGSAVDVQGEERDVPGRSSREPDSDLVTPGRG